MNEFEIFDPGVEIDPIPGRIRYLAKINMVLSIGLIMAVGLVVYYIHKDNSENEKDK